VTAPLEGRWALVYSTQQSENEERSALDSEVSRGSWLSGVVAVLFISARAVVG
jgi:hypothetical protein